MASSNLSEAKQYSRCISVLSTLLTFLDINEAGAGPHTELYAKVLDSTKLCMRALPTKKLSAGASRDLAGIFNALTQELVDASADKPQAFSERLNMFTWFLADITTLCPLYCNSIRTEWDALNEELLVLAEAFAKNKDAMYEKGKHLYLQVADVVW